MANFKQDTPETGATRFSQPAPQCAECEAALTDVLDGTLTKEEQTQFDLHLSTCVACSQMLADAQRGAAWLEMLRTPRPEPPAALLERILAQTLNSPAGQSSVAVAGLTQAGVMDGVAGADMAPRMATVLPFRRRVTAAFHRNSIGHAILQPRLAMTAAMAFFSVGLTLNLTGVQLNQLRLSSLKPANVRRSFYQADAHIVRYYTNLRVVYELESRVRDLQRISDGDTPAEPAKKQGDEPKEGSGQKQTHPPGAGTSRRQQLESSREVRTLAVLRCNTFVTRPHTIAQEGEPV